ncbi:30S ribosomal protein S10 alpha, chloroplastic-like isoform X1 [Amaranthus tricolor]|uniref:30S ribosomal protein S10 alpha, chloroplastic-like isoform X1 n=1 Tax=Amaranthus tricolor TaxID=29722 RepID=UPI002588DFD8|nr:30S ribosomal protein S10 alpha, chloroplastic-like isoform X1 [Amaranthus tricolor]XP_057539459.1 30S ribosomal protein S10 alpha, chloroplastic-like isoform X1 [Amaranthus tricolor]
MATCSLSAALLSPLTLSNASSIPTKHEFSAPSLVNLRRTLSPSHTLWNNSNFTTFAAPEALETVPESFQNGSETSSLSIAADQMAPKQKIRIKLRSYWVPLIEDSCKQIMDAARTTNAKTMGPVPLPTKKRIYCVLKSPHVHKDARFHFEIRTHQRLIDILYPTAQTIDSLMQLDLPAGVDVEVKL